MESKVEQHFLEKEQLAYDSCIELRNILKHLVDEPIFNRESTIEFHIMKKDPSYVQKRPTYYTGCGELRSFITDVNRSDSSIKIDMSRLRQSHDKSIDMISSTDQTTGWGKNRRRIVKYELFDYRRDRGLDGRG